MGGGAPPACRPAPAACPSPARSPVLYEPLPTGTAAQRGDPGACTG